MLTVRRLFLVLAACVALGLAPAVARADEVIIGGSSGPANAFPFGINTYTGAYQQVYASSAFTTGPVTITQIAFATSTAVGTRNLNLSLGLSTTPRPPGGLSTVYSANRGPDFATVFSGAQTITPTPAAGDFDVVFNITPFTYNPAQGNLLLDVFINSASGPTIFFVAGIDARSSRVFNLAGGGAPTADATSLLTRFTTGTTTTTVPEPATMVLLGIGLAGVVGAVRRRRKS